MNCLKSGATATPGNAGVAEQRMTQQQHSTALLDSGLFLVRHWVGVTKQQAHDVRHPLYLAAVLSPTA